jgi:hypothetical protein
MLEAGLKPHYHRNPSSGGALVKSWVALLLACLGVAVAFGCRGNAPAPSDESLASRPATAESETETPAANAPENSEPPAPPPTPIDHNGVVKETMNAAGYTYLEVDKGGKTVWLAAPEMELKKGDKVEAPPGMPMKDFTSRTLRRTFPMIYFVGYVKVVNPEEPVAPAPAKASPVVPDPAAALDFKGLTRPDGGLTVAEIFAGKARLEGKPVVIRAKVVKFSPDIMGKNWVHLRDGTGSTGTDDITVTTSAKPEVGDTVLVKGVVALERDFGHGYKYDVLIENAEITVEE